MAIGSKVQYRPQGCGAGDEWIVLSSWYRQHLPNHSRIGLLFPCSWGGQRRPQSKQVGALIYSIGRVRPSPYSCSLGCTLLLIQSDQSTPKFKNSEVKFRKKSHKNSFGGELEIVQYRDLLHLQTQKLTMNNAKVLSEYFEVNEVESCA